MIIWLASYPRSGNTLLRLILRGAFNLPSLSQYNDRDDIAAAPDVAERVGHQLHSGDWPAEYARLSESADLHLVKTHGEEPDNAPAIYVVRDGRLAAESLLHYLRDYQRSAMPFSLDDVIAGYSPFASWSDHLDSWQPLTRPRTLLLRYEAMLCEPEQTIFRISQFLERDPVGDWTNEFDALRRQSPQFFRFGSADPATLKWSVEQQRLFYAWHHSWMKALDYPSPDQPVPLMPAARRRISRSLQLSFNLQAAGGRLAELESTCALRDETIALLRREVDETAQQNLQLQSELERQSSQRRDQEAQLLQAKTSFESSAARSAALQSSIQAIGNDPFQWLLASHTIWSPPVRFDPRHLSGVVSVIVPIYNATAFLRRAVQSIFQQSPISIEIELLLCDDGSTDGSLEMCHELARQSTMPTRVLSHPDRANLGVSATRNLGLAAARGEWIALLDADDAWHANRLAVQFEFLSHHPQVDCVCALGINRDAQGRNIPGWTGSYTAGDYSHLAEQVFHPPYTFEQLLIGDPVVNSTLLIRKVAIEAVGGYPRLMAHQAEDWLLLTQLALHQPIALIAEPLIDYTLHPGSYTSQFMSHDFTHGARLEFLHYLLHWMAQQPRYRARAAELYRSLYPRLLGERAKAYRLVENYYAAHHGDVADVAGFEKHLNGLYAELETLRAFHNAYAGPISLMGKMPGAARAYAAITQWWHQRFSSVATNRSPLPRQS